ncbi:MAG TPA: AraC family transcriptional regulator [Hydrogenophaga sp.]|uniref:AraC family transcriptional regulator n=1 Tax=Hydrogenophaga sp. TaxID=1904254 RepID=UPI002D1670AA|nr:AraC family transcriptional regulator [Hydrogenophaga sp.]HSX92060.1 AraC family transcriptional regulator [Hydrogenophaga sp.]
MAEIDRSSDAPAFAMTADIAPRIAAMRPLVERHATHDGMFPTPIPGLQLIRAGAPSEPLGVMYRPSLCLLLAGRKRVFLSDQVTEYGERCHLVVSQDLPLVGQVIEATAADPYLCLHLRIEQTEVSQMVLDHGLPREPAGACAPAARGLYTEPSTVPLADALLRLVQLLDTPGDVAALAPLIRREILYRLLSSPNGWRIARTAQADSGDQRIARVIAVMRARFREPLGVPELADIAHLSPSALHQHFKAVTSLTPLQYLKQLRLQEARRLLVTADMDAASVAFDIGYESPSQFSREYARQFGEPPRRDKQRLLDAGASRWLS